MKYKDPNTGDFKEIYVKALDSMPVGTEVDFDGQASDIPVGWEQVDDVPVYSATETVCGTWFGKPLYKKSYNTYTASGNNLLLDTMSNINIIKFEGAVKINFTDPGNNINYWRDINVADSTMGTFRSVYSTEANQLIISRANFNASYNVVGVAVSVYYTKTTD